MMQLRFVNKKLSLWAFLLLANWITLRWCLAEFFLIIEFLSGIMDFAVANFLLDYVLAHLNIPMPLETSCHRKTLIVKRASESWASTKFRMKLFE